MQYCVWGGTRNHSGKWSLCPRKENLDVTADFYQFTWVAGVLMFREISYLLCCRLNMQRGHEREPAACKSKKQEGKDRKGEEATKGNKEGSEKERKWKNECHEPWHCMWSCKQTPQQTVCWTHNYKPEVRGKEKITVTQRDYSLCSLKILFVSWTSVRYWNVLQLHTFHCCFWTGPLHWHHSVTGSGYT